MMKVQNSFQKKYAADRGVALLFALGILSALMLLGIAFMGSSIFSRRIAENRSNGNEARLLARSTANLVAAAVMLYDANNGNDILPADFSAVFSRVQGNDGNQDEYGEFLRGYQRIPGGDDYSRLDVTRRAPFGGKKSLAQWVYVHDNDGNIVGRYAYQVVPKLSLNRINANRMLSGPSRSQERCTETSSTPGTYDFSPQDARFGQEIGEIPFLQTVLETQGWKDAQKKLKDPEKVPVYFADIFAAGIFAGDRNDVDDCLFRAWFESNFSEGKARSFREIAPKKTKTASESEVILPRFNLTEWTPSGKYDAWLIRFKEDNDPADPAELAGSQILERMTRTSTGITGTNPKKVVYDSELSPKERGGLPFLRYIGNDPGSFEKLETLRYQIAANFNDYCDADSIPTSDVTGTWSPANAPTYTGNEKTLCINELVLGGIFNFVKDTDNASLSIAVADLVLGVEAVDVYGVSDSSGYKLVNETTGTAKVEVHPKLLVPKYTYKIQDGADSTVSKTGDNYECSDLSDDDLKASDGGAGKPEQTLNWAAVSSPSSDVALGSLASGYAFGAKKTAELGTDEDGKKPEWKYDGGQLKEKVCKKLKKWLEETNQGKTITDVKITEALKLKSAQVKIKDINISLGGQGIALLKGTDNADYTRTQPIDLGTSGEDYNITDPNFACGFLVGGMEAKDPRQNLNVSSNANARKRDASASDWLTSDWVWDPDVIPFGQDFSSKADVISTKGNWATTADLVKDMNDMDKWKGEVNKSAKARPNDPPTKELYDDEQAVDPTKANKLYDDEQAVDPAWLGSDDDKHISTAVIRNAPMKSPWELGFIHRGVQFQTINLKKADKEKIKKITDEITDESKNVWDSSSGTAYAEGDGGILDWIKMTGCSHSYGKINLRQYFNNERATTSDIRYEGKKIEVNGDSWKEYDKDLLDALFSSIPKDTAAEFVNKSSDTKYENSSEFVSIDVEEKVYKPLGKLSVPSDEDARLRSSLLRSLDWATLETVPKNEENDASQERLIGRTFNLLTMTSEPDPVFYAVIIAQTIKDVGGGTAVSSDHPEDRDNGTGPASLGAFNLQKNNTRDNIHYDVITGEAKILVTYERNPVTGQVIIRDIENIE